MATKIDIRLLVMKCLTIGLALLAGFGVVEIVLRSFPSLIGPSILSQMEPTIRAEIAARLGLPTLESAIQITPEMRTDKGPTIVLPAPNSVTHIYADKVDRDLGAVETVQVDENGFCNDAKKAELNRADVLIAGDSFTFCLAVTANDTGAQKLESLSGLSVYNLGVRGVGPDEHLELIKKFTPIFKPRVIVMNIYEGNDLRDVLIKKRFAERGDDRKKKPRPAWSYAAQVLKAGIAMAIKAIEPDEHNFRYSANVGGNTMLMNVSNRDQGEVDQAFDLRDGKISVGAYEAPIKAFVDYTKSAGVAALITYIPSMYTAYESKVQFEDGNVGSAVQAFSAAQRKWFEDHAATMGFNFVDLTPFFQEAAAKGVITHFPSNVHLTPMGHEIVARNTWGALQKILPAQTP